MDTQKIKDNVGKAAAGLIHSGMLVGLGTGSTAICFIKHLAERCKKDELKIKAVASSKASLDLAKSLGIPLIDINTVTSLDITVDGSDEIDENKYMIKGGGGALVREKIVACMSKEMVVIVDETKLVTKLGKHKLPVEILPFACRATEHKIEKIGYKGAWRKNGTSLYITDNGNYIYDIHFPHLCDNPKQDHEALRHIPVGVVDTGFFFDIAGRVLVGFNDGQVIIK